MLLKLPARSLHPKKRKSQKKELLMLRVIRSLLMIRSK